MNRFLFAASVVALAGTGLAACTTTAPLPTYNIETFCAADTKGLSKPHTNNAYCLETQNVTRNELAKIDIKDKALQYCLNDQGVRQTGNYGAIKVCYDTLKTLPENTWKNHKTN